jgi:hypothetical protein
MLYKEFTTEYLRSLSPTRIPLSDLRLKVSALIILLYNLNIRYRLYNRTRIIVTAIR